MLMAVVWIAFWVCGCTPLKSEQKSDLHLAIPAPLRIPMPEPVTETMTKALSSQKQSNGNELRFVETPTIQGPENHITSGSTAFKKEIRGEPVSINIDGMALPAFINEIYGNILHQAFEIDSVLQKKMDLVTLRTDMDIPPSELAGLARQVLGNYGVAVENQGSLLRFVPGKSKSHGAPPLLVSGRSLPDVPFSHRPVFQLVPLTVVRNTSVRGWLTQAYKGQDLEIFEDSERNAILLKGPPAIVEQAIEAVRLLDRPNMRGHHSMRIEPVFLEPAELAAMLKDVLHSEGYAVSLKPPMGSIIILPMEEVGALLVFAGDEATLFHVLAWARNLDAPGKKDERSEGLFYYQVQNTNAGELAGVLGKVLSAGASQSSVSQKNTAAIKSSKKTAGSAEIVVDEGRNGIIFQGTKNQWNQLLRVIEKMDVPGRMVLIEVTVADVTLSDEDELGMSLELENLDIGGADGVLDILKGSVGGSGLTYTLDNAGQINAVLNAFSSKSNVNILSTPRIMVKSGSEATIDVGTEVPIITSQATSSDLTSDGESSILQSVQYRKTGVLLTVKPVIHSGNRVDLEITQEVSESKPNTTTNISSPDIYNRKITTTLGLKDGGSVLLGGLISTSDDSGYSGVPILSEIPILGRFFRVEKNSKNRTEMIMLIVPYIINNSKEAEAVTRDLRKKLYSGSSKDVGIY